MTLSRREKDDLDGVFDLLFSGTAPGDDGVGSESFPTPDVDSPALPVELRAEEPGGAPVASLEGPVLACASCDPRRSSAYFQVALTAALDESLPPPRAIAVAVPAEDSPLTRALAFAVSAHVLWLADDAESHARGRSYLAGLRWGRPGARVFVLGSNAAVAAVAGPLAREELAIVEGGPWLAGQPLPPEFRSWAPSLSLPPVSLAWAFDLVDARCA